MKAKFISFAAVILCACVMSTYAQTAANSSAVYDETIWNTKKRKVIMDQMNLSEGEKSSFWPIYESYSRAIAFMENENLQIIMACADKSHPLDPRDIEAYSKRLLQNDLLLDRLRIQYYKKLSKALSPARASQFIQLDDNLRMMLRFEVQNSVKSSNEAQASIR